MPVGAKSIKRAASKAATKPEQDKAEKKDVTSSTIAAISPEVVEQLGIRINEVCHLTEELPIHLL